MQNSNIIENHIAASLLSKDGKHGVLLDLCSALSVESSIRPSADLIFSSALTALFRIFFLLYSRDLSLLPKKLKSKINALVKTANKIADSPLSKKKPFILHNSLQIIYDELGSDYGCGLFEHCHNDCTHFLKDITLNDNLIAKIINGLTVYKNSKGEEESVNYWEIDIRFMGTIYENLLDYQPHLPTKERIFYITMQRKGRRSSGSFYTPRQIVSDVVSGAVGNKLKEIIARYKPGNPEKFINNEILTMRVLDPAMGAGYFLIEAVDEISRRIISFLKKENALVGQTADLDYWRRRVAKNCIFGVDKNPLTADLARLFLWIAIGGGKNSFSFLNNNLKTGNSLTGDINGKFEVIIGNPPYGAILDKEEKNYIKAHYPPPWHNETHNIVVPFIFQSWQLLSGGGYLSFIIPKALTYVDKWKTVRKFLLQKTDLCRVTDNGQSFGGVLLEMVTFTTRKTKPDPKTKVETGRLYTGKYARFGAKQPFNLNKKYLSERAFLISINQPKIEKLYRRVTKKSISLGAVADIYRGLSINNQLEEQNSTPEFEAILRGRHIRPYEIGGRSYVDKARIAGFRPGALLFQEIVAHVYTPIPHIKLIGTMNPQNLPSVNTVTNISLKANSKFTPEFILCALQSKIINWYIYKFIYINAFRTMHFSGSYAAIAPLPDMPEKTINEVSGVVQKMQDGLLDINKGKKMLERYFIDFYANQSTPAETIEEILNVY